MASIVGSSKYGEGHQIIIKDPTQISSVIKKLFVDNGYTPGKSIFSITKTSKLNDINQIIELGSGKESIILKDEKNKLLLLKGTESAINGCFNHYSDNSKSNTGALTELKELISMAMFESAIEKNTILTEEQLIEKFKNKKELYNSIFYESAVKQTRALKEFLENQKGFEYERQAQDKTKQLYVIARKLSGKANDNWNPADVWMIHKKFDIKTIIDSKSINELNNKITLAFQQRMLIHISLKQVTNKNALLEITDPASQMGKKLEYDMSFSKVDLSDTFANFIVQTKSGFAVRCGFKASATTLNVSLEGRFIGAGYQLGAVDAKQYGPHQKEKYNYTVRSGTGVTPSNYQLAKKELKQIFQKYPRLSNSDALKNFKDAETIFEKSDKLTKDRFANLISYLYSFMISPGNNFEENISFCYFSSKKLSSDSSLYIVIK